MRPDLNPFGRCALIDWDKARASNPGVQPREEDDAFPLQERCSPRQKSRVERLKAKVEPLLTYVTAENWRFFEDTVRLTRELVCRTPQAKSIAAFERARHHSEFSRARLFSEFSEAMHPQQLSSEKEHTLSPLMAKLMSSHRLRTMR